MKPISYRTTLRVKKANFANRASKRVLNLILLVSYLLLIVGIILVAIFAVALANGLIATGLALFIFVIWAKSDLGNIAAVYNPDAAEIALDDVVSADIVASINAQMSPWQLMSVIYKHWQISFIVLRYELDLSYITSTLSHNATDSVALWNRAFLIAGQVPVKEISAGVLFVAMMIENKSVEEKLAANGMDIQDIIGGLLWEESLWQRVLKPKTKETFGGIGRDWAAGFTPVLDRFGHNISLAIAKGHQDFSSVSRGHVIEQMLNDLSKSDGRHNIALVGETGVGKTALVYALAEKLIKGKDVSENLAYKQIVQIDLGAITAATGQQVNLEALFNEIIQNVIKAGNIILFFDEAQLFFGHETGTVNIANILLPVLQGTQVKVIISMNHQDWHQLSLTHSSLAQLFSKIEVEPTDKDQTIAILQDIAIVLEVKYKYPITFKALQAAYDLSDRYIQTKALPAKAIDLLSDSMNYPINGLITAESVAKTTEIITNTKVAEATGLEKQQLLNLESLIHQRMINQKRAVEVVSNTLRRSRTNIRNPNRPAGSFLFLGPTGVGKTELCKSLAEVYFGNEKSMIRLDMSEYQNPSDVERLLQAPSATISGSVFLQQVNQNPFSVVLLDEIEKAYPDILNLLLQILDEGTLTDSIGHKVSFKDSIIICTSNAGANEIRAQIEAGQKLEDFKDKFIDQLIEQNVFKPELINRFDEVVLFRPLTKEELLQVANLILKSVNKQLEDRKIVVELTFDALQYLVEIGYDPRLGARPMRRAISRLVENIVAKRLLSGELQRGQILKLDATQLKNVNNQ